MAKLTRTRKTRNDRPFACSVSLILMTALLAVSALPLTHGQYASINTRIDGAIAWLDGEKASDGVIAGYAKTPSGLESNRIYASDQALVALALASFQDTHNRRDHEPKLRVALDFLRAARTTRGDVREFYDAQTHSWSSEVSFGSWNAYALMGLASAPTIILTKWTDDPLYWSDALANAKMIVDVWVNSRVKPDGSWRFAYPSGQDGSRISENGAALVGLSYLALSESRWGSSSQALRYADLAQRLARWILNNQEMNENAWGYGGFYDDESRATQSSATNGLALFGVDMYYRTIRGSVPNPSPTLDEARTSMIDWYEGFASRTRDSHGGPYRFRGANISATYPKLVKSAGWVIQALVDIWVNIGTEIYMTEAARTYEWLTGNNELRVDLQRAPNRLGATGGFYFSIANATSVDPSADIESSLVALYALVKAELINIPEFPNAPLLLVAVCVVLFMTQRRRRVSQRI